MTRKIILIAMLLVATAARAFDFSAAAPTGQTVYYSIVPAMQEVMVVSPATDWEDYDTPSGLLVLPDTVVHNDISYRVTMIDAEAFSMCVDMTGIVIPEGVYKIGRMAFFSCTSLDSVSLPSTLLYIGTQAFNNTAFQNINSSHWRDGLLIADGYLIKVRQNLTDSVTVPEGVQGVGNMAFAYCGALEKVSLPTTLLFIGEQTFTSCNALHTVVSLAEDAPYVGQSIFDNPPAVSVYIPCHTSEVYRDHGWLNPLEEMCPPDTTDTTGIADVAMAGLRLTPVSGGLLIENEGNETCIVSDVMGRTVAQRRSGFVALPAKGVYLVSLPGRKAIKVMYLK